MGLPAVFLVFAENCVSFRSFSVKQALRGIDNYYELRYITNNDISVYVIGGRIMGRRANSGALTESVFYILLRLHRPAHGYALMKDIAQMTNGRVSLGAGSLYGALDTLQKKGWIKALDDHPQDRRIEYIITDTGKKLFEKEIIRLEELLRNAELMKEAAYEDNREKDFSGYTKGGRMAE